MNCGLRHFGNDVMQLAYRHASICTNFSFDFLKNFVRDQRWPTAHLFVVNISLSGEFTAPVRHMLPIHNITINSNNLFVNLTAFTSSTYFLLATTKAFVFFLYYIIFLTIYYHHQFAPKAEECNLISRYSG